MKEKTPNNVASPDTPTSRKGANEIPELTNSSNAQSNYRVGYGRPPQSTQFKKGQSGNPRGRKKGFRNFRTVVESELNQTIPLRQGDKVRRVTKQQALVLTLVDGALKRDPKAIVPLITFLRSVGILDEAPEPTKTRAGHRP